MSRRRPLQTVLRVRAVKETQARVALATAIKDATEARTATEQAAATLAGTAPTVGTLSGDQLRLAGHLAATGRAQLDTAQRRHVAAAAEVSERTGTWQQRLAERDATESVLDERNKAERRDSERRQQAELDALVAARYGREDRR